MPGLRLRGLVLLFALAGVQVLTVGSALAGAPSCACDAEMCVHHPGHHHSGRHASSQHASAQRAEAPAEAHCDHDAAAAPRECSMRGCEQHHDQGLPLSPLASLPHPTSFASPEGVGVLSSVAALSLLDRPSAIEPPPPRSFPV